MNKKTKCGLLVTLGGCLAITVGLLAACVSVPAEHDHVYTNWETVTPATCTVGGSEKAACDVCGMEEVRATDPLGHDMVRTGGVAATCTQAGTDARKCSRCDIEDSVVVEPLGHLWSENTPTVRLIALANCDKDGAREVNCERCRELVEVPIPALGHLWAAEETVVSRPTCTEEGAQLAHCERCSTEGTIAIPALGHDFETVYTIDKPANFSEAGSKSRHCSRCEEVTDVVEIPMLEVDKATQYIFRIVRTNGTLLEISGDVTVHVKDSESGKEEAPITIRKGKAVAALLPKTYTVTVEGIPTGYTAETGYTVSWENPTCDIVLTGSLLTGTPAAGVNYVTGSVMYDFTLTTIATASRPQAETLTLSGLLKEKRAVVLNFWYVGCQFCRYEFPGMEAAYQQYKNDIAIIAIDPQDASADAIRNFANSYGLSFYVAQDINGLAERFKVSSYPTTVVIDREGVVSELHASALVNPNDYSDLAYCTQQFTNLFERYAPLGKATAVQHALLPKRED